MFDNLDELSKLKGIIKIKRLLINKEIKNIIGPSLSKEARKNSKKIYVYRIEYKTKVGKCVGYIIEPKRGKNLPIIVWNRGGNRDFASIKTGLLFTNYALIAPLALNGYVVVATQYPGVAGGDGLDKMGSEEDLSSIIDLFNIIKKYKKTNPESVGMYGNSRGGMMTYMLLAKVNWIKCAVIGSSSTDEVNASNFRSGWKEHQKKIWGGSLAENKRRSALYWPEKITKKAPILIMQGTADWRVNPLDSLNMSIKLYENKVPHRLIMFEGADHAMKEFREQYVSETLSWFERFLKRKEKLPDLNPHGK